MSRTRPYLVNFQGKNRIVDATSIAAATKHVLAPHIAALEAQVTAVTPASASEVAAFAREGGTIELQGVYPAPEPEKKPDILAGEREAAAAGSEPAGEGDHAPD